MSSDAELNAWKKGLSWNEVIDRFEAISEGRIRELYRKYLGDDSALSTEEVRRRYLKLFQATLGSLREEYSKDPEQVRKMMLDALKRLGD